MPKSNVFGFEGVSMLPYMDDTQKLLLKHEGLRLKPYRDTVGKLTIGIGRNLDDVGITRNEAMRLLLNDIDRVVKKLDNFAPWWRKLDHVRQMVVVDMAFNLGVNGFLKFRKAIAAMKIEDWEEAAKEMLDSKWATQVVNRAIELSEMMRTGEMQ
jgi:lysozyme